jgi:uncharacterized membrane protein YcjF (UPF0283 family)
MVLLFSDIFLVRRAFPASFEEVRVSHSGLLYASGAVGVGASLLGAVVTFKTPWNPDLFSNSSWRWWLAVMTIVSMLVAVVIYVVSDLTHRRERRHQADAVART